MPATARIDLVERNMVLSIQELLKNILKTGDVKGVLVASRASGDTAPMPALVVDPDQLDSADPLAPAFPINAARMVSKLTRKPLGERIAVVLRPCEIRAFIELVKLKQGSLEDVVMIGTDCLGAYSNVDYPRFASSDGIESTVRFCENALAGKSAWVDDLDISPACKACVHPVPEAADLLIGLIGADLNESLFVTARNGKGEQLLRRLGLHAASEPAGRKDAIAALISERTAYRDQMFQETSAATADLDKLVGYLSNCVNCYNCRVACPVCYCKECVFSTDVFDHEPVQYLRWAGKKGILRMPVDTVFYHLTRLAHMSLSCIGCGQCSNACPNNVPVAELFRTVAHCTQAAFDYESGRSVDEAPPLSVFQEEEFPEVTGGKH